MSNGEEGIKKVILFLDSNQKWTPKSYTSNLAKAVLSLPEGTIVAIRTLWVKYGITFFEVAESSYFDAHSGTTNAFRERKPEFLEGVLNVPSEEIISDVLHTFKASSLII